MGTAPQMHSRGRWRGGNWQAANNVGAGIPVRQLITFLQDDTAPGDGKDREMTEMSTYPLRLPRSLKKAVEKQSEEDGTSINQFVAAVAEKLSALHVAEFFADRKARADFKAFDKIMKRRGGKPPRTGDEMPR
jgi:hypothetical protein